MYSDSPWLCRRQLWCTRLPQNSSISKCFLYSQAASPGKRKTSAKTGTTLYNFLNKPGMSAKSRLLLIYKFFYINVLYWVGLIHYEQALSIRLTKSSYTGQTIVLLEFVLPLLCLTGPVAVVVVRSCGRCRLALSGRFARLCRPAVRRAEAWTAAGNARTNTGYHPAN